MIGDRILIAMRGPLVRVRARRPGYLAGRLARIGEQRLLPRLEAEFALAAGDVDLLPVPHTAPPARAA